MARRGDRITVVVVRTGGIAAVRREWRMSADGDAASDLEALVESADWQTTAVDPSARDRFVWSITVSGSTGRRRATVPETRLDGPLRHLVTRVQEHGDVGSPGSHADRSSG